MKPTRLILILFFLAGTIAAQDLSVYDLSCEHKKDPVGLDLKNPRFSWKIHGTGSILSAKFP